MWDSLLHVFAGSVRLSFWRSSFAIAPHKDLKRGQKAVRITYALARRPSSAACIFPSIMHREAAALQVDEKMFHMDIPWYAIWLYMTGVTVYIYIYYMIYCNVCTQLWFVKHSQHTYICTYYTSISIQQPVVSFTVKDLTVTGEWMFFTVSFMLFRPVPGGKDADEFQRILAG